MGAQMTAHEASHRHLSRGWRRVTQAAMTVGCQEQQPIPVCYGAESSRFLLVSGSAALSRGKEQDWVKRRKQMCEASSYDEKRNEESIRYNKKVKNTSDWQAVACKNRWDVIKVKSTGSARYSQDLTTWHSPSASLIWAYHHNDTSACSFIQLRMSMWGYTLISLQWGLTRQQMSVHIIRQGTVGAAVAREKCEVWDARSSPCAQVSLGRTIKRQGAPGGQASTLNGTAVISVWLCVCSLDTVMVTTCSLCPT